MALLDRLFESAVAVAAAPLFTPDFVCGRRPGLTPLTAASVAPADAAFAVAAAEKGLAEVALSELALRRARSEPVREFARRMVAEHSDMNAELLRLGVSKRIALPMTPTAADRAERDHLDTLHEGTFEGAYLDRMIADHEEAVKLFADQADGGTDVELTAFAARNLPALRDHLAACRQLPAAPRGVKRGRKTQG
ncbi:MAG: DUF4142 domain-containing protein [Solirubrobacterales bacterium]